MNAYTHITYGAFYAAVLPPGSPGAICLAVPQWQPRLPAAQGDIRQSIIPRGFRVLPDDIQEMVDTYFHIQELEDRANRDADDNQEMSTDMEAAVTEMTPSERPCGYRIIAEGCA